MKCVVCGQDGICFNHKCDEKKENKIEASRQAMARRIEDGDQIYYPTYNTRLRDGFAMMNGSNDR